MDDTAIDAEMALDQEHEREELGEPACAPDPRFLWGSEGARALLVVLTRCLGPDFAREVSNEIASRTLAYEAGCPDDRTDGETMQVLLQDQFWDRLFAMKPPA